MKMIIDDKQEIKTLIKGLIAQEGMTMNELNDKLNLAYERTASLQNLSAKLNRNSLRAVELLEILNVLGYTIEIHK